MGRRRSDSRVRSDRKGERNRESNRRNSRSDRYDESDHSSICSNAEEFLADEYDYRDGHSDYSSESDGSHKHRNRRGRNKSYRREPSHHLEEYSESEGSDSSRFRKRGSGKGSKSRRDYEDRNSDNRSVFSARIERIKMEHDDSSLHSIESDAHLARSMRHSNHETHAPKSNPNPLESSHRSLLLQKQHSMRSLGQMSVNLNSSFRGQHQMQTPVTPGNKQMLRRSSSSRSLGGAGQTVFPGQYHAPLNQSQSQRMPEFYGNNVEGNHTPRVQVGPGHLTRSASGRSLASGQVQLNRSTRNLGVQTPREVNPGPIIGNSQIAQGANDRGYRSSLRNALPSPPVYAQQAGVMNMPSQNILVGNQDVSMGSQRPGLMRTTSKGNMIANDMVLKNGIRTEQPRLIRTASQKGFIYNVPLNSPRPDLRRVSSQRSLGNANAFNSSDPNARMDSSHQLMLRNPNQHREDLPSTYSVTGDSVVVVPDMMETISNLSSSRRGSLLSTRSRRTLPPESLADQIYSRSQSRHGDAYSQETSYDPPGEDSFRWDGRSIGMYSDDLTYDSYRSDRKSCVTDPPDMNDESRIYSDVSVDELKQDKCDESFRSNDDRRDLFDEELSYDSRINEDELASFSHSSSGSHRRKKHRKRIRKPSKRADPVETDLINKSERVSHSKKRDTNKKNGDISSTTKQASMGWLAQQISARKLSDKKSTSRNLEPEGASSARNDISSKGPKAPDADGFNGSVCDIQLDASFRRRKSEYDEQSSLSSEEAGCTSKKKVLKAGIVRSDDSTDTTNTMSREVPSVIVSVQTGLQDSFSDSDSFLSPLHDQSHQRISKKRHEPSSRTTQRNEKETRNREHHERRNKAKNHSKPQNYDGRGLKEESTIERMKSPKKKSGSRADHGTQERSSKTKRNGSESKGQKSEHRKAESRKSNKTRSNISSNQEHVAPQSIKDQSVISLIDHLKSLECEV